MNNQIATTQTTDLATTEMVPVRLTVGQKNLPLTILCSLPQILKLEIEHPLFKDSPEQLNVLNKVVRMLAPQFKDAEDRKAAGGEWIIFCQSFRLTPLEIVEAYRMALAKELKIFDESKAYRNTEYDGEYIKVYPNLSLITAGEILNAYIHHKRIDKKIESGRKIISDYLNKAPEITAEQKKEQQLKLWETLKYAVRNNKPCQHAFLFFDKLALKGSFEDFYADKDKQNQLLVQKMNRVVVREFRNPVIFSKHEAKKMYEAWRNKEEIPIHNVAVIEVKNDLVYNFVKKQLKENGSK